VPGHNTELTWQLNINDEENYTILSSIDEIPSRPLAVEKQRGNAGSISELHTRD